MAIRSGELGLPAIIGSGEKLYKLWSSANILKLDCAAKRVEIVAEVSRDKSKGRNLQEI